MLAALGAPTISPPTEGCCSLCCALICCFTLTRHLGNGRTDVSLGTNQSYRPEHPVLQSAPPAEGGALFRASRKSQVAPPSPTPVYSVCYGMQPYGALPGTCTHPRGGQCSHLPVGSLIGLRRRDQRRLTSILFTLLISTDQWSLSPSLCLSLRVLTPLVRCPCH